MTKLTRNEQRLLADYGICYPFEPGDMARLLLRVAQARDIADHGWTEEGVDPLDCLANIGALLRPAPPTRAEVQEVAPVVAAWKDDTDTPRGKSTERRDRIRDALREHLDGEPEGAA